MKARYIVIILLSGLSVFFGKCDGTEDNRINTYTYGIAVSADQSNKSADFTYVDGTATYKPYVTRVMPFTVGFTSNYPIEAGGYLLNIPSGVNVIMAISVSGYSENGIYYTRYKSASNETFSSLALCFSPSEYNY